MAGIFYVIAIGFVIIYIIFNLMGYSVGPHSKYKEDYERCVLRGVEYYKAIDSYPKILYGPNQGTQAIDVAKDRCKDDTDSFNGADNTDEKE